MAAPENSSLRDVLNALKKAAESAREATLPTDEDHYFYSNNPDFKTQTAGFLDRIQALLASYPGAAPLPPSTFRNAADVQEWVEGMLDDTLGRVDDALVDAKRAKEVKTQEPPQQQPKPPAPAASARPATAARGYVSYMASTLQEKPQDEFTVKMDNSNTPFVHNFSNLKGVVDVDAAAAAGPTAIHPLRAHLDSLAYPEWQTTAPDTPHAYKHFNETPFSYIDTPEALTAAATRLAAAREIAVDLEAHNYRSFQGFCCLMQLSTREEDLIIDVLTLRDYLGPALAPLFADPQIVKILHGADGDIVWLQRDFGIYVANLFDTGQAARVLNYAGHGLGYLLDKLCGFKADKRWQLADWRLRPLSEEAIHYARADTHYLLHCYDRLRAELVAADGAPVPPHLALPLPPGGPQGALGTVLERSRRLCLQMYEKELLNEDSFMGLYDKLNKDFSDRQLSVFAALYAWRDKIARELDESFGFVLSRAQLTSVAEALPITAAELTRTLGKGGALAQARAREVLAVIAAAKEDTKRAAELKATWNETAAERAANAAREYSSGVGLPPHRAGGHGGVGSVLPDMAAAAAAAAASVAPPPPPPPAPAAGLKPKAIKPLAGGAALQLRGVGAPKLAVAGASSLFGAMLDGARGGHGGASKVPDSVGFGAIQPAAEFAAPAAAAAAAAEEPESAAAADEQPEMTEAEKKAAVRAAMKGLAAEQAAEDAGAAAPPAALEEAEDFMPLALSDKYSLTRKEKRRQTAPGGGGGGGKKQRRHGEGDDSAQVKQTFKDLGLDGDGDEEEGEGGKEEEGAVDYTAAATKYDMGIINPHKRGGGRGRGRGGRGRGRGGDRGRGGRGGRGGGRGGRGRGEEQAGPPPGRFNPYAGLDMSDVKGGKRSSVHVRSGNKSSGWK